MDRNDWIKSATVDELRYELIAQDAEREIYLNENAALRKAVIEAEWRSVDVYEEDGASGPSTVMDDACPFCHAIKAKPEYGLDRVWTVDGRRIATGYLEWRGDHWVDDAIPF